MYKQMGHRGWTCLSQSGVPVCRREQKAEDMLLPLSILPECADLAGLSAPGNLFSPAKAFFRFVRNAALLVSWALQVWNKGRALSILCIPCKIVTMFSF